MLDLCINLNGKRERRKLTSLMTSNTTLKMLKFKGSIENDFLSVMLMKMTKMTGKHSRERCKLRRSNFLRLLFEEFRAGSLSSGTK